MNITEVRIWLLTNQESKLKAIASVTIGNAIVIHDIKIIDGAEGLFIAMPSRKTGKMNTEISFTPSTQKRAQS